MGLNFLFFIYVYLRLLWKPLVTIKDQYSHLVYPNVCIKKQTCEILESISHRSCKRIVTEKNTLVAQIVVLSDA